MNNQLLCQATLGDIGGIFNVERFEDTEPFLEIKY